jgi:predicted phosphodiesterase
MIDDPLTAQASEVFSASTSASPRSLPVVPSRKLYALGDIHLSFKPNRVAWEELRPHPTDGLILVGDVGETKEHCEMAFSKAKSCFHTVFWCPGNHELYTLASHKDGKRGVDKYMECVEVARANGVITPGKIRITTVGQE